MDLVFQIIKMFWPLWLLLLVLALIRIFFDFILPELIHAWKIRRSFKKGEVWRSDQDLLHWLRGMNPTEFEEYVAGLFSSLGFSAQAVGKSHDGGIDVIAEKDGVKHYIQCKKYITSTVPVSAVRDFYGALADHLAHGKGYFITTNKFTLEAEKFAEDKPIELCDGFKLIDLIRSAEEKGENKKEICPKCGGTLVVKEGKFGKFFGCSNYPKCDYTASIK